jgi:hypothetical protein
MEAYSPMFLLYSENRPEGNKIVLRAEWVFGK